MANGGSSNTTPNRQTSTAFACRVSQDITDPSGIQFQKGMQGDFNGMSTKHEGIAFVLMRGVMEGDGFNYRTIPRDCLNVGRPWKDDINDWHLTVNLATNYFHIQNWTGVSSPHTTVLETTIIRLLTSSPKSPLAYSSPKLLDYLRTLNVAVASRIILQGIKNTGLYEMLSNPQPFDSQAIISRARVRMQEHNLSNERGMYARFHVASDKGTTWKKKTSYLYVGKSVNFGLSCQSHRNSTTSYGELTATPRPCV
jgi:hypothetical protein